MISVNLISKKRKVRKDRNIFLYVIYGVFGLFVAYFVIYTSYIVVSMLVTSNSLSKVQTESESLSSQILKDNTKLNKYILTKSILSEIRSVKSSQFDYKGVLNRIISFIPSGSDVKGVSFSTKGMVEVLVVSYDDLSFKQFENNLRLMKTGSANGDFSGAAIQSVDRNPDGSFRSTVLFGLSKSNGGTK